MRLLDKEGNPGPMDTYADIVRVNLLGTFNTLRLVAARMARNPLTPEGERGVCVLTASVAAYEGQIGQIGYASSKAGVVGMTIVAARDLASKAIRVCTIAPGIFDTPMLARVSAEARKTLAASVPHPARLGSPDSTRNWPSTSSAIPCSTAKPSAWMARCAWRRADPIRPTPKETPP